MIRGQCSIPAAVVALLTLALAMPGVRPASAQERRPPQASSRHPGGTAEHGHDHGKSENLDGSGGHAHAEIPSEYATAHLPASAWTSPRMLARGETIYRERCAVCHGDAGDGRGAATAALPVKPPDLRDSRMVGGMRGNYWFWRVSEGGAVEPFRSAGSTMPPWKDMLSVEDRWAVVAYQHRFSGHTGPHVPSEHSEMLAIDDPHAAATRPDSRSPTHGGPHQH